MSTGTVLVVEDDEDVRDTVSFVLRRAGHRVVEARHGREALEHILAHGAPDLILLDMNMPVMNGHELARELRARSSVVPIVVFTAAHDAQRSAEEIGAAGFIGKPFDVTDLVAAVEHHLAQSVARMS
jgi:CheY-like chemotaxis protein